MNDEIRARVERVLAEQGGRSPEEIRLKADVVLSALRGSLARGLIHRNRAGQELTTELEVLQCMREEGMVTLQQPIRPREVYVRSRAE